MDEHVLDYKEGLLGRETVEDFREHGRLTTHAVEMSSVARDLGEDGAAEVYAAVEAVQQACERFREAVWLPWLKGYYVTARDRGHVARGGAVEMLVYGLAGRVMVTLRGRESSDDFVSLLGYDGESDGMYVRGADGSSGRLCAMIEEAVRLTQTLEDDIRSDDEVGLAL